jgi:DNA-binding NarL/FixJ family response regulator
VVIVDNHPLWRQALRGELETQDWVGEIVEAGNVEEAMRVIQDGDVVAMDIYLPNGGDGIAAAQDLMRRCPCARVAIVTMSLTHDDYDRAVAAGVHGYVVKDLDPEAMVEALRIVASGESFLDSPPVTSVALPPSADLPPPFDKLTSGERRILAQVIDDQPNKQIARNLDLSHQHVRNTLSEIYVKLGVKGRMGVPKLMREKRIERLD